MSEHTKNIEAIEWNESPDIEGRWHQALAASRSADALERIAGVLEGVDITNLFLRCPHGVAFCQRCLGDQGAFKR